MEKGRGKDPELGGVIEIVQGFGGFIKGSCLKLKFEVPKVWSA